MLPHSLSPGPLGRCEWPLLVPPLASWFISCSSSIIVEICWLANSTLSPYSSEKLFVWTWLNQAFTVMLVWVTPCFLTRQAPGPILVRCCSPLEHDGETKGDLEMQFVAQGQKL
jgi:hypothetical protein